MFGWPWLKRAKKEETLADCQEGKKAKESASQGLKEELERMPEVVRVSDYLRRARQKNHFGEAMMELFRGGDEK